MYVIVIGSYHICRRKILVCKLLPLKGMYVQHLEITKFYKLRHGSNKVLMLVNRRPYNIACTVST